MHFVRRKNRSQPKRWTTATRCLIDIAFILRFLFYVFLSLFPKIARCTCWMRLDTAGCCMQHTIHTTKCVSVECVIMCCWVIPKPNAGLNAKKKTKRNEKEICRSDVYEITIATLRCHSAAPSIGRVKSSIWHWAPLFRCPLLFISCRVVGGGGVCDGDISACKKTWSVVHFL